MNRKKVILTLMKQKNLPNYLEIGVFSGHIFFKVKSKYKIAIDPEFRFNTLRKTTKFILNPYNYYNKFFEKTSDLFFKEDAPSLLKDKKINLALIDGMHEYLFALNDIENTLNYLSDDGIIVVHDCNPRKAADAVSFEEWKARNYTATWNGNVWRTILHLRCLREDINVFTLDCDHGIGIITKTKNETKLNYSLEEIRRFTFADFDANRSSWINLKPADYFYDYFHLRK